MLCALNLIRKPHLHFTTNTESVLPYPLAHSHLVWNGRHEGRSSCCVKSVPCHSVVFSSISWLTLSQVLLEVSTVEFPPCPPCFSSSCIACCVVLFSSHLRKDRLKLRRKTVVNHMCIKWQFCKHFPDFFLRCETLYSVSPLIFQALIFVCCFSHKTPSQPLKMSFFLLEYQAPGMWGSDSRDCFTTHVLLSLLVLH